MMLNMGTADMKRIIFTVSVAVLAVAAPVTAQATADVSTGKVLAYPNAGIALAVPNGFEYQVITRPSGVVRALWQVRDQSPVSVVFMAIPVKLGMTAEMYADMREAQLRKLPDVYDFMLLKKTSIPAAGLAGTARLISFTAKKTETIALRAYFIRTIKKTNLYICYVLTVTAASPRQKDILGVFAAIMKSIELITIKPPSPAKIEGPASVMTDQKRGYSIRVPRGWHIRQTPTGVALVVTDYARGGRMTPVASVSVASIDEGTGAPAAGMKFLEAFTSHFEAKAGLANKLLSQTRTKMAGFDGYQAVLQQTPKPLSVSDPSAQTRKARVVVQRTICALAAAPNQKKNSQRNAYVLTVFLDGKDSKAAVAMTEKLAAGFAIIMATIKPVIAPVATQPASTPATAPAAKTTPTATKPATTPAATQPATTRGIRIVPIP